ncbi:MAG: carboxypeptidase-like regulatory domain-containing protein [Bacteroidota bacterium]|nr:carboxypeptidase-like regulatory domain-containing protein [Bacteroidota bacterium]
MPRQNHLHISIPKPCSMKWEEMEHLDEQSRSCSSCEKVIVDFTTMSDDELVSFFHKNKNACGKFTASQLNRHLKIDRTAVRAGSWKNIFILPALFLGIETFAREKTNISESKSNVHFIFENTSANSSGQSRASKTSNDPLIIKGTVKDSLTGEGIIGAVVFLSDSSKFGAVTDFDGNFSLKIANPPENDSIHLIIKSVGYETVVKRVDLTGAPLTIHLRMQKISNERVYQKGPEEVFVGMIAIDYSPQPKTRHFFYKLFHPRSW